MTRKTAGKIVVISGPSGSGKTTICHELCKAPDRLLSVSATTRPRRAGEREGVDYYFVSRDKFLQDVERGEFLEWAEYNGNLYGTPRGPVIEALKQGKTVVFDIDIQGGKQIRDAFDEALLVFIRPPSWEELRWRLQNRHTETIEEIDKRLQIARDELKAASFYDAIVVNDRVERSVAEIEHLIEKAEPVRLTV